MSVTVTETQRSRPCRVDVAPTSEAGRIERFDFTGTRSARRDDGNSVGEIVRHGPIINDSVFHAKQVRSLANTEVSAGSRHNDATPTFASRPNGRQVGNG